MFSFRLVCVCLAVVVALGGDSGFVNGAILTRAEWGGLEPSGPLAALELPVARVIVAHSAGMPCSNREMCSQQVRNIQSYHMKSFRFDDIGYNFLIGDDGNVYEGRGWQHQGAFARGYNAGSVGVVFLGVFEKSLPSEAALSAFHELIASGVSQGSVAGDYKLLGHRQVSSTLSPGSALYGAIKEWPHWSSQV